MPPKLTKKEQDRIVTRLGVVTCPTILGIFALFAWLMANVAGWMALAWPFACAGAVGALWTWQCRKHGIKLNTKPGREQADLIAAKSVGKLASVEEMVPQAKRVRGRNYRYQLLPGTSRGAEIAGLVFFNLFWNGIVSVFLVTALLGHWGGMAVCLFLFLIPFVAIGAWMFLHLIGRILVTMRVRAPVLEIDAEPLAPGMAAKARLELRGGFHIERLELRLVCEERATYRQGTDSRTETHEAFGETILEDGPEQVSSYRKYQATADFAIPAEAMHTFKARNNEIGWALRLKVAIRKWPDFEQGFLIRVVPDEVRKRLS
jgi:hypothetical protein